MENLTFRKGKTAQEGKEFDVWYAECNSIMDAINVAVKRSVAGDIAVLARASSTDEWDLKRTFLFTTKNPNFNLCSDVYPMCWRIESYTEVISGTLNKNQ